MDLNAYLHRIGYSGPVRPDLETMRAVHRAHGLAIPYEGLSVQLKQRTTTDVGAAYAKLVEQRRGGWCYEMNGVFGWALEQIGFNVTRLAGDGVEPASHLVLRVDLDGASYVCDVGFADGPCEPYALVDGSFAQQGFEYRVELLEEGRWRLHNHRFGIVPGFIAGPPNEAGMQERCALLQTQPDSPFVQNAVVFRRTPEGFISLLGRVLRTVKPDGISKAEISSAEEYVETLKTRFDLDLPEAATLWPAICARHEEIMREQAARRAAQAAAQS